MSNRFAAFATGFLGQANANMAAARKQEDEWALRYADQYMQGLKLFQAAKAQRTAELKRLEAMTARTGDRDLANYIVQNGIKDEDIIDRLMIDKANRKPINGMPEPQEPAAQQQSDPFQAVLQGVLGEKYQQPQNTQQQKPMQNGVMAAQPQKPKTFGAMLGLSRDPATGAWAKAAQQMGVDPQQMQQVASGDFEGMLPQLPQMEGGGRISLRPDPKDDPMYQFNAKMAAAGYATGSPQYKKALDIASGLAPRARELAPRQDDQLTRYMVAAGIDPKSPEGQQIYRARLKGDNSDTAPEDEFGYVTNPKMETQLRKEIAANPTFKNYQTVRSMMASMQDALTRRNKQSDLNLIYGIAKVMDPDSVVRESELELAISTGVFGDKLQSAIAQVKRDSALTDETRAALADESMSRYKAYKAETEYQKNQYMNILRQYKINPERVFVNNMGDLPVLSGGEAVKPAEDASSEPADTMEPPKLIQTNPEPAKEEPKPAPAAQAAEPVKAKIDKNMTYDEFMALSSEDRDKAIQELPPETIERIADEMEKRKGNKE